MSRTDAVLAAIDAALADPTVSADAMRSAPDRAEPGLGRSEWELNGWTELGATDDAFVWPEQGQMFAGPGIRIAGPPTAHIWITAASLSPGRGITWDFGIEP